MKAIRVGWDSFSRFVGFIGDGRTVRFWHDMWCAESDLAFLFLEPFQLAANKDAMVSMVGCIGAQSL